jgi:hypothetical protein
MFSRKQSTRAWLYLVKMDKMPTTYPLMLPPTLPFTLPFTMPFTM